VNVLRLSVAIAVGGLVAVPARPVTAQTRPGTAIDIPFQKFVLDNGLTLIVHEDHKAPIVAVNVWYHVGSKNERPGRTGFAHLFEHLMFQGSEHFKGDYISAMERIGATDLNGTTNEDRTNYFENVPTSALDYALWMESDRMGHLLGGLDQGKLDEQRGVVQNEKRQDEDQPYAKVYDLAPAATYPAGHPYSWSVIGSMDDLNAASLDNVKQWFGTYYGPANAVLVVAGDVDAATVRHKVERYFGDIPSGPPIVKQGPWIAKRTSTHRTILQDRVPQARIYKVWNVPQWSSADADYLDLVTDVLASGKTSRLYKRLVYDDRVATDVAAFIDGREIGSQVWIQATAQPGGDLSVVEKELDEEVAKFIAQGPTAEEVRRVTTQYRANFLRGVERIGGFGGKSDVLAKGQVFAGDPDHYQVQVQRVAATTPQDLQRAARDWLSTGAYVVEVHPFPDYKTASAGADRSAPPAVGTPPNASFPKVERAELSNGLKIVLAQRHSIPQVDFRLLLDAGYAADQFATPGSSSLEMNMLDEGTTSRSSLEISEQLALLGARLSTGANLDMSVVSLSALKDKLDSSLAIFADVILHPAFPQADLDRLKQQTIAGIRREKVTPVSMALRVFPRLLYGPGHAYSNPLTGSGTEQTVAAMTRDDLVKFHQTWFKPNHATLVVVGDTHMSEIRPVLERLFHDWRPGTVPAKNIATVPQPAKPMVYLLDRPGSAQSIIFAGHLAPPKSNPDEIAIETLNTLLGGAFDSRMNMNLREDKHWSYGAFTILWDARGQQLFFAYAPVQTDKTKESMAEVAKELSGIRGTKPVTADELTQAQNNETLALPGRWETMGAVANSLDEIVRFGLPDTYYDTYASRVRSLTVAELNKIAERVVQPADHIVWVVVGDRAKIEPGIRELNLGEIQLIDADGKVIQAANSGTR
jgi:zinc protease